MPRVAVLFTGGTISMRSAPESGGFTPSLTSTDLLRKVPGVHAIAEVEAIDWGLVPGSHLSFDQVLDIGGLVREQLERPDIDGVVIVQGTDNMEETAFAWDLLPLPPKPVVVVGAMRSASQDGFDGPDNLRNAIAAAAHGGLADQGVVVAMAGTIHGADDVRKTHTHAYETFRSVNTGPLGFLANGEVALVRRREPQRLPSIPDSVPRIGFVTALLGEESVNLHADAAGLVVEAMGGGNTQPALLDLAREVMQRGRPVVLTTRCPSGSVRPGYSFPGGSTTWWEAGALFSGYLGGPKSRIALAFGIGCGLDRAFLATFFAHYGGGGRE